MRIDNGTKGASHVFTLVRMVQVAGTAHTSARLPFPGDWESGIVVVGVAHPLIREWAYNTRRYKAIGVPSPRDGGRTDIPRACVWHSSIASVASVPETGSP